MASSTGDEKNKQNKNHEAQSVNDATNDTPEEKNGRPWHFYPVVGFAVIAAIFLVGLIGAVLIALLADPDDAANWVGIIRDVFIIVLAMEGLLMGIALIVLVLQLAALINLLQNEIPPIMDNANETVTTVRGTAQFISESVVEPVLKIGAATTGVGALLRELLRLRRTVRAADKAKAAASAAQATSKPGSD